jgi:hypothetical protein
MKSRKKTVGKKLIYLTIIAMAVLSLHATIAIFFTCTQSNTKK